MTKLHILPRENGWAVKKEGAKRASRVLTTKTQAVAWAKNAIGLQDYVFVHNQDGAIQRIVGAGNKKIPIEAMDKKRIHILPSNSDWAVKTEKAAKPSRVFGSKYQAVRYAHQMADKNNAAMVVHNSNGQISEVDIPPHFTSPASALLHV